MTDIPQIHYLNTDLDLVCDVDPAVLVSELKSFGLYVHVSAGEDGLFYAMCEDTNDTEPEPNIKRILDAIETLSTEARRVWNQCSKREFNVGYDCGDEPWAFNQGLSNEILKRIAASGSSFRMTIYPYKPVSDETTSQ